MTTAQSPKEPVHSSSPPRRSVVDGTPLSTPAASVVLPVAQARLPARSSRTVRATSARVDRSGALPSRGLTAAEGRVRASASH